MNKYTTLLFLSALLTACVGKKECPPCVCPSSSDTTKGGIHVTQSGYDLPLYHGITPKVLCSLASSFIQEQTEASQTNGWGGFLDNSTLVFGSPSKPYYYAGMQYYLCAKEDAHSNLASIYITYRAFNDYDLDATDEANFKIEDEAEYYVSTDAFSYEAYGTSDKDVKSFLKKHHASSFTKNPIIKGKNFKADHATFAKLFAGENEDYYGFFVGKELVNLTQQDQSKCYFGVPKGLTYILGRDETENDNKIRLMLMVATDNPKGTNMVCCGDPTSAASAERSWPPAGK